MALSVARSLVTSAANKAASEAMDEVALLMGVRTEIWYIKDELRIMQAFLRTAERMKDKDELVKVWAEQVEELSYDIKYCLGEFMFNLGHPGCVQRLTKLRVRHQIAVQIRNLKVRVGEVSTRIQRYSHLMNPITSTCIDERISYEDETTSYMEDIPNRSHSFIDESELVGFWKPKLELIRLMDVNTKDGPPKVICVVGMCGIGKTTLARKTYESQEDIVKNFSCRAWITVSQSFSKIEMLKNIIKQFLGGDSLEKCLHDLEGKKLQEKDLSNYLKNKLVGKRYVIILDDLSHKHDWDWIKDFAYPFSNNKGSRVIVTTRDVGLARQCTRDESLIYHLKPLDLSDATALLLRNTRKTHEYMDIDQDFKNIVKKLVQKCGCLPLAILIIGGILATKKIVEWEHVFNQLPSKLESSSSPEAVKRMVTLSYNHLPSHLKPCFLYLCIFPAEFEIQTRHLIDRWIVEGFVTSNFGMDIEDVAMSYFYELINRGIIQPSRVNVQGMVKSFLVNGVISDVMASVSRDENFVYLSRDIIKSTPEDNFRHVAHHGQKCPKISIDWSHVRSFTVFAVSPMDPAPSICSAYLRMLNVLDLQGAQCSITQKDVNNIGLLRRLKYVNVRGHSNICALPGSIGKLHGLQYLDVRNTSITSLPTEITKLHSLISLCCSNEKIHLYGPHEGLMLTLCLPMVFTAFGCSGFRAESGGVRVPRGIGDLQELQILEVVDIKRTSDRAIKELGELKQLRKLSVVTAGATKKKCKILRVAIEKLPSLYSLSVDVGKTSMGWLHSVSSPPPVMRSLKLVGYLGEMPDWLGNLMYLVKIQLQHSGLKGGKIMGLLGALPNLMLLGLHGNAYAGEQLVFGEGAFPNLRKLDFNGSPGVREVRFEEGTSPHMETMQFGHCELESGVIGVKHLLKLTEISLGSAGKVANLGVLEGEVDAHPNRPILRLKDDRRYHDLGDVVQGSTAAARAEEATVAGESSSSLVVVEPTGSDSSQDPDIREVVVEGSALVEDDFWSCNSDDDDDAS